MTKRKKDSFFPLHTYSFKHKDTRWWSLTEESVLMRSITVLWALVVSGSTMKPSRVLPEAMAVGIPFGVV